MDATYVTLTELATDDTARARRWLSRLSEDDLDSLRDRAEEDDAIQLVDEIDAELCSRTLWDD